MSGISAMPLSGLFGDIYKFSKLKNGVSCIMVEKTKDNVLEKVLCMYERITVYFILVRI